MHRINAIYARQSADRADSISIESQIDFCVFETHGEPFEIFADRGYSGKNTDRPEFLRMLEQIKTGMFRRVICYKLDRCSRSILDFTNLMEFFRQYGVEFISCTEKFDTSGPMGRAMLNICIVFAQLERETIQQRVYDAYHARCKFGFYMGGRVPFGYVLGPYMLGDKRTSCYVPNEAEEDILRELFALYARPGWSLGDTILAMEARGIRNPRREDGEWIRAHVGRILRNPVYVKADLSVYYYFKECGISIHNPPEDFVGIHGCYLYTDRQDGKKLLVLAPHEGLICADIWLACRRKGRRECAFTPPCVKHTWLAGRIKCGYCGYAMVVRKVKGCNCFRCSASLESTKRCTSTVTVDTEALQAIIAPEIERLLEQMISCQNAAENDRTPRDRIRVAALENEAHLLMEKLPDANSVVFARIQQRLTEIDRELHNELICAEKRLQEARDPVKINGATLWDTSSMEDKIRIVHTLIRRIDVTETGVLIYWEV